VFADDSTLVGCVASEALTDGSKVEWNAVCFYQH
jgi:hypothetical protein